jgi:sporulation protein YlmC with PRC-barrel domain
MVKLLEIIGKMVFAYDFVVGKVTNVLLDPKDLKITHLEVELNNKATKELFGAKKAFRNNLAVSALKEGEEAFSGRGVELKVSIGQLNIYLRPTGQ